MRQLTSANAATRIRINHSPEEALLTDLEKVWLGLTRAFRAAHPLLGIPAITMITQRCVDRLVAIGLLEQRGVSAQAQMQGWQDWGDFTDACRQYNEWYGMALPLFRQDDSGMLATMKDASLQDAVASTVAALNPGGGVHIPVRSLGAVYERFLSKEFIDEDKGVQLREKAALRKAGGVYYTPEYVVDYIVSETVGKKVEGKSPAEVADMRFADIACGSGAFLLGIYEALLLHRESWNQLLPDKVSNVSSTLEVRGAILRNCIRGVDIDPQAIAIAQLSLFLRMLEGCGPESLLRPELMPDFSRIVCCGDSLAGPGSSAVPGTPEAPHPFDFGAAFPEVFERVSPGFDAIVGNPPYGAALDSRARKQFAVRFGMGTTDTAALFLAQSDLLRREDGRLGFIIPKAFTYASNWKAARSLLLPRLHTVVDCAKVWKKVKLEMSIVITGENGSPAYSTYKRQGEEARFCAVVNKSDCAPFDFIINGVTNRELVVAIKMSAGSNRLSDYVTNKRGGMLQQRLTMTEGPLRVWGGKQIGRYRTSATPKGFVDDAAIDAQSFVAQDAILVQNIVAHVANPVPHIIIAATIPSSINGLVILDTINQLRNISELSVYYLLGVLNSRLLSWYVYRFVFANAIRTMHFDAATTRRIPFPDIDLSNPGDKALHEQIDVLARRRLRAAPDEAMVIDQQIERAVSAAFRLSADDLNAVHLTDNSAADG